MIRNLAFVLVALLAGCVKTPPTQPAGPSEPVRISGGGDVAMGHTVYRVVDRQTGVACYIVNHSDISCVKVAGGAP